MTAPRNRTARNATPDVEETVSAGAAALDHTDTGLVNNPTPDAPPLEEVVTTDGAPSQRQRRNGDPTVELHAPVPDVSEPEQFSGESIGNSTNALTPHCMAILGGRTDEVSIPTGIPVEGYSDLDRVYLAALGTTNVEQGAYNTAIRSNVYRFPKGKGQRASVVLKDGTVVLMASGTKYASYFARATRDDVAASAIVYFNQANNGENPFVSVRKYRTRDLPQPVGQDDSL